MYDNDDDECSDVLPSTSATVVDPTNDNDGIGDMISFGTTVRH